MHLAAGRYDFLLIGHDQREQLVKHVKLDAGGRYVLEVNDAWMMGR